MRICSHLPPCYCVLLLFGFGLAAYGQAPPSPLGATAFAAPADVIAAAAKITPEKYAKVTVLFEEEKNVLDADGRVTNTHRLLYRIEAQAGLEEFSESSVGWEAFYQNEPTIRARVIRTDGGVVELDPKTITDVPARNEGDGTYSDERIHKAPLPALSVGAIVESETKCNDKEPFFSGGGVYRFFVQRDVPVTHTRLVTEAPAVLNLQYRVGLLPDVAIRDETAGGIRRLTFDQGYLPPRVNSDINLATHLPHEPWIEVATGKSWEAVAESYRLLADPQIRPDQVKDFIGGATATSGPPAEPQSRIAFIQQLVSRLHKEVRYTGIEFGQSKLQPQVPAEVLKRHYGDCKDKAALLVSMLRAAGIAANLALLNAGPGRDVTPALPGMNQFDHAIVYVPPPGTGGTALWIDATAEFTKVGDLPYGDQGRMALIIAAGTKDLSLIPEPRPEDSVLVDSKEYVLADYGAAKATESSHTSGYIDSYYRSAYGDPGRKELKISLENYVRNTYAAKALTKVESGDAKDFTKPFSFRLEIEKSKRGNTGISDAVAVLYPTGAFGDLPRWFFYDPDQNNQKLSAEELADRQKSLEQRSSDYDVQPFIVERRYRLIAPRGFSLRALPPDKTARMGPAELTQTYTTDASGIITATYRFNTGKARYTTEEALELRKAVIAADKEDAVTIFFDQAGAKQLAAGNVRGALTIDRGLIESQEHDPLPHIRMAYALLAAGVGDKARREALQATVLDPKSALAFRTLGWVLEHNSISVRLGKGFDWQGAIDAYRKSKNLDSEDLETRINLAYLYEYDASGVRYGSVKGMKNAIQEYRDLGKQDKPSGEQYEDNLIYNLLYCKQYKEVLAELDPLPASVVRNSLGVTATTAIDGLDAGLKRADRVSGDRAQRSTALGYAGQQLMALRMYPEATGAFSASIQGQEDAAGIARQIEVIRNLKPYIPPSSDSTSAVGVLDSMFVHAFTNTLDQAEVEKIISRSGYANETEWQESLRKNETLSEVLLLTAARSGFTPTTFLDIFMGTMKVSSKGDDATGYQVTVQSLGSSAQQFFVMKEQDGCRIVASQGDVIEVGNAALFFLHHGNEPAARHLLDWKRDLIHRGGGDDPLSGLLFARVWTSGESKGVESIELASAALIATRPNIASMLPAIAARNEKWTPAQGKPDQTDFNLVLAHGYLTVGDEPKALQASEALLKDYPDSITALRLVGSAYGLAKNWTGWNGMLDAQLAKHPSDRDLLSARAVASQSEGDFAGARKFLRAILDGGQAVSGDYNFFAWNSLFEKTVDAEALQAGQQANMLTKNSNFAELHTLACLYAAQGKTTEAKQVILQAMAAANQVEPNSEAWYVWGAIYQQYGLSDAAIDAFEKVKKIEGRGSPTDTYILAQAHLKELQG